MDLLFMGGISAAWFGLIRLRAEAFEPKKETGKAREGLKNSHHTCPGLTWVPGAGSHKRSTVARQFIVTN
jgi:hypothetical protein